jgi:hypothetical protein
MGSGTESDVEELAYWRRRAVALAGVLAVVGLLAWTCGGGDDKPAGAAGAAGTPSPSGSPRGIPAVVPTVTVTATAKVTVRPDAPKKDGDACARDDVVVGFAMDGDTYPGGRRPQFRVSVVNTGERTCAFRADPRALRIQITSGADRIWSSEHCATGAGSSVRLRRGIPYIQTVTWDRRRSAVGCPRRRPAARPGTYVAELKGDGVRTQRRVFHLR